MGRGRFAVGVRAGTRLSAAQALPEQRGWHRRVLTLAFPIVLANLTQPILGAVDTAVAGHLGSAADLGGVALVLRREQFERRQVNLSRDRRGGISEHHREQRETQWK